MAGKNHFKNLRRKIKAKRGLAYGLSVILHPVIMPSVLFLIIVTTYPIIVNPLSEDGRYFLLGLIFLSTFLFPLVSVTLLWGFRKNKNIIENLEMGQHKARVVPLAFTGFIYLGIAYLLFTTLRMNTVVVVIMASMGVTVILVAAISYFWKISAHVVGVSGVIGFLFYLNNRYADGAFFYLILGLILLCGILASARLALNSHTPAQVLGGAILGFVISYFSLYFFG